MKLHLLIMSLFLALVSMGCQKESETPTSVAGVTTQSLTTTDVTSGSAGSFEVKILDNLKMQLKLVNVPVSGYANLSDVLTSDVKFEFATPTAPVAVFNGSKVKFTLTFHSSTDYSKVTVSDISGKGMYAMAIPALTTALNNLLNIYAGMYLDYNASTGSYIDRVLGNYDFQGQCIFIRYGTNVVGVLKATHALNPVTSDPNDTYTTEELNAAGTIPVNLNQKASTDSFISADPYDPALNESIEFKGNFPINTEASGSYKAKWLDGYTYTGTFTASIQKF